MKVYTTDVREFSGLKCRIEMRLNQGVWQQRHIWYPSPDNPYPPAEGRADPWIRSIQTGPGPNYHLR